MSEELKPCPFCGGGAHIERGAILWAVVCPCASHVFYGCEQSAEKTVKAWNTRAERTCRNKEAHTGTLLFICSECGKGIDNYGFQYCPWCGAKVEP